MKVPRVSRSSWVRRRATCWSTDATSLDRIIANLSRRAAFHAEDEARLIARRGERVAGDPSSHPVWRDETAALMATTQLAALAEKHRRRVHVLHISSAAEMAYLADHKRWVSVEVTPHHLTLAAPDCYDQLGTYCQMNPAGARCLSPRGDMGGGEIGRRRCPGV